MHTTAVPCLGALMLLCACSTESDTPIDSMELLRSGDSRVCVAPDVEETLRSIIKPKGLNAAGYSIDFKLTSLQIFDKQVGKAVCSTSISIMGPEGAIVENAELNFELVPDARTQAGFIVSLPAADIRARLAEAIETAASVKASAEADAADQSRLEALVKPRWLTGRWVGQEQGSNACVNGPYWDFGRRNVLRSSDGSGSWRLDGTQLQMVSPTRSTTIQITEADDMMLGFMNEDGVIEAYRRCTSADVSQAAPEAELTPAQNVSEESGNAS